LKTGAGISKRFIIAIAIFFTSLLVILSIAFHIILKTNLSIIREVLVKNNQDLLLDKVKLITQRLKMDSIKEKDELKNKLQEYCMEDDSFLAVIIFLKTSDDNYFQVFEHIPLNQSLSLDISKNTVVREDKEINYIKKGLYTPTIDPQIRLSRGIYWQSLYIPYSINRKVIVLEFIMSASKTYFALNEYSEEISRIKKYVIILTVFLIVAVIVSGFLFMHNFSLLISNLSKSINKAAKGELDVNLNPETDEELSELALSFNSLIGELKELKAKEKIIQELEKKDSLTDIFKFGVDLLKENRVDDSIIIFNALILMKSGFGSYFNLGVAYAKKQDYARALKMFEEAIQSNPGHEITLQYIEKVKKLQIHYGSAATATAR